MIPNGGLYGQLWPNTPTASRVARIKSGRLIWPSLCIAPGVPTDFHCMSHHHCHCWLARLPQFACLLACYFGLDRKSEDYAMIHHCHDCPYQRRCNTPSSTIFSPFSDTRSMVFGFHQKWVRYAIDGIGRGIH